MELTPSSSISLTSLLLRLGGSNYSLLTHWFNWVWQLCQLFCTQDSTTDIIGFFPHSCTETYTFLWLLHQTITQRGKCHSNDSSENLKFPSLTTPTSISVATTGSCACGWTMKASMPVRAYVHVHNQPLWSEPSSSTWKSLQLSFLEKPTSGM